MTPRTVFSPRNKASQPHGPRYDSVASGPAWVGALRPMATNIVGAISLIAASACASEPYAVEVGDIGFLQNEVLGLTPDRLQSLGELTALGVAFRSGAAESLIEPAVRRAEREYLASAVLAYEALADAEVDRTTLRARYLTNPELELTVRHLVVLAEPFEPDSVREEARRKVIAAAARVTAGEPFSDVAGDVSEEPGARERGGLLDPGREGTWVPEFWAAARGLVEGEVSGLVETVYGYHLLKLERRGVVPLEEPEVLASSMVEVARLMGADLTPSALAAPSVSISTGSIEAMFTGEMNDTTVLASGVGWQLTAGEVRDDLAAGTREQWITGFTDIELIEQAVAASAHLEYAEAQAGQLGLAPPPEIADDLRTEWEHSLVRWSAQLGFSEIRTDDELKAAARAALGATAQGPTVARSEVGDRAPLVLRRIRVSVPDPSG